MRRRSILLAIVLAVPPADGPGRRRPEPRPRPHPEARRGRRPPRDAAAAGHEDPIRAGSVRKRRAASDPAAAAGEEGRSGRRRAPSRPQGDRARPGRHPTAARLALGRARCRRPRRRGGGAASRRIRPKTGGSIPTRTTFRSAPGGSAGTPGTGTDRRIDAIAVARQLGIPDVHGHAHAGTGDRGAFRAEAVPVSTRARRLAATLPPPTRRRAFPRDGSLRPCSSRWSMRSAAAIGARLAARASPDAFALQNAGPVFSTDDHGESLGPHAHLVDADAAPLRRPARRLRLRRRGISLAHGGREMPPADHLAFPPNDARDMARGQGPIPAERSAAPHDGRVAARPGAQGSRAWAGVIGSSSTARTIAPTARRSPSRAATRRCIGMKDGPNDVRRPDRGLPPRKRHCRWPVAGGKHVRPSPPIRIPTDPVTPFGGRSGVPDMLVEGRVSEASPMLSDGMPGTPSGGARAGRPSASARRRLVDDLPIGPPEVVDGHASRITCEVIVFIPEAPMMSGRSCMSLVRGDLAALAAFEAANADPAAAFERRFRLPRRGRRLRSVRRLAEGPADDRGGGPARPVGGLRAGTSSIPRAAMRRRDGDRAAAAPPASRLEWRAEGEVSRRGGTRRSRPSTCGRSPPCLGVASFRPPSARWRMVPVMAAEPPAPRSKPNAAGGAALPQPRYVSRGPAGRPAVVRTCPSETRIVKIVATAMRSGLETATSTQSGRSTTGASSP